MANHTYIQTDRHTYRQTYIHTYRQTDRQTDRQTVDRQTNRQADIINIDTNKRYFLNDGMILCIVLCWFQQTLCMKQVEGMNDVYKNIVLAAPNKNLRKYFL